VKPRAGLDAMVERKISSPCRESNPGRSVRSLVAKPAVIPLKFIVERFILGNNMIVLI
jgi:hypothetical protein